MRFARKLVLAALGLLAVVWLVFSWFEAGKEIRILCSGFHSGTERKHVVHTLETGEYLRYRSEAGADSPIVADSMYNLRMSRCVIEFEGGRVLSATHE